MIISDFTGNTFPVARSSCIYPSFPFHTVLLAVVVILETVEEKPHDVALACLDSESLKAWLGTPWQDSTPEVRFFNLYFNIKT